MKKIQYLIFGVLLICNYSIMAQVFDDSLYIHLYNYQVIKGELKDAELKDKNIRDCFNIENLIDSTNSELFGIYKFYNLEYEEALTSFLVVGKENIEIYDILSFDALIERILDITTCDEEIKTIWVKEVLKMLRHYYEDTDMEKLVMQKKYGIYHYFIPLENLKIKEGIIK